MGNRTIPEIIATCPALSLAERQSDVRKYIGVSMKSAAKTIGGKDVDNE